MNAARIEVPEQGNVVIRNMTIIISAGMFVAHVRGDGLLLKLKRSRLLPFDRDFLCIV